MSVLSANAAVGAAVVLGVVAVLLAALGFLGARRLKNARLAMIGLAFLVLAAQAGWLLFRMVEVRGDLAAGTGVAGFLWTELALQAGVVVLLYLAVLKR